MKWKLPALAGLLALTNCTSTPPAPETPAAEKREPAAGARFVNIKGFQVPLHSLESVPPTEAQALLETDQLFTALFRDQYGKPDPNRPNNSGLPLTGTRRGVHPKAHGCIKGQMTVRRDIWKQDAVGIFQPGARYDVVLRFSNAGPRALNHDKTPDSRGLGIKVLNVRGPHVLGPRALRPGEAMSQDFTMNTADTFFSEDAARYSRFMRTAILETTDFAAAANMFLKKEFNGILGLGASALREFTVGDGVGFRIASTFLKIRDYKMTNPLGASYNSIAAFQHGNGPNAMTVKYAAVPCQGPWLEKADETNPNFIRERLVNHITKKPACFSFQIQRNAENSLPVEDLTIAWDQQLSPFEEIARIELPAQPLMDEMACEALVIQPWNSLPEHKPVGGVNRMRLSSYLFSIEQRRKTNRY